MCNVQTELIRSKGYPCEDHTVTTVDGFILSLQRIPHGKQNSEKLASRPVAFLQHGLLDSSATWVENSANQSLGAYGALVMHSCQTLTFYKSFHDQ